MSNEMELKLNRGLLALSKILDDALSFLSAEQQLELYKALRRLLELAESSRDAEGQERAFRSLQVAATRFRFDDELRDAVSKLNEQKRASRGSFGMMTFDRPGVPDFSESVATREPTTAEIVSRLRSAIPEAPPPARTTLETWPLVQAPNEVGESCVFEVDVLTTAEKRDDASQQLRIDHEGPDPCLLAVELILPADGALEPLGAITGHLEVVDGKDSATLRFRLRAKRQGVHRLTVEFRYRQVARLRLDHQVTVKDPDEVQPSHGSHGGAVTATAAGERPTLVLSYEQRGREGDKTSYRAILQGPVALLPKGAIQDHFTVPYGEHELIRAYVKEIEKVKTAPEALRASRYSSLGIRLANTIIPREIQDALASKRFAAGTPLHIETDDVWAPWELACLGSGAERFFLGHRFAISRGLRMGIQSAQIRAGEIVLVAPRGSNLDSAKAKDALKVFTDRPHEVFEAVPLVGVFASNPPIQVLHFVCHGGANSGHIEDSSLELDDAPLETGDVPVLEKERTDEAPLYRSFVFVNACKAGQEALQLLGHGSWATAFVRGGAAAVIAPSWSVNDAIAAEFEKTFYDLAAKSNTTVAEAARRARIETANAPFADNLAYAAYTPPELTLATGPTADR